MEEKLIVEEPPKVKEKKKLDQYSYKHQDVISITGIFSNLFFYWAYKIIKLANLTEITKSDLGFTSDINSISSYISTVFHYKSKTQSIIKTIISSHMLEIILIIFFNLIDLCLSITTIILLRLYIQEFNNPKEIKDWNWTYKIAAGLLSAKLLSSFLSKQNEKRQTVFAFKGAAELNCLIFEKLLSSFTDTKSKFSSAEIINFVQVDSAKLIQGLKLFPSLINVPIILVIFSVFLFSFMGISYFIGLGTLFCLIMLNIFLQRIMSRRQKEKQIAIDQRMKITSSTLFNLKFLKMYSWENFFLKKICDSRDNEIGCLRNFFRVANKIRTLLWFCPVGTSIASIGAYLYFTNNIKIADIFICLAIFNSLQDKLREFGNVLSGIIEMMVSMRRIESFLNVKEYNYKDNYITNNSKENEKDIDIKIENGNFEWTIQNSSNSKNKDNKTEDKEAIKINVNESFGLHNINLSIGKGELIFIVGEVGSGKTSLFHSILGNMHPSKSSKITINGSISYVSQIPWIQNESLKNNILFYKEYNEEQYNKAIEAAILKRDLEILIKGDLTEIGEKGINLSGGQKMRVALARSVYADKDIYLFDEPFGALDANVSIQVMDECINKTLKNKTRLVITHNLNFLTYADRIIYMKEGKVQFIGKYNELIKEDYYKSFLSSKKETSNNKKVEREKSNHKETQKVQNNIQKEITHPHQKHMAQNKSLNLKTIMKYIKLNGGARFFFFIIINAIIWQICRGANDIWLGNWLKQQDISRLYFFLVFLGLGIIASMILYIRLILFSRETLKGSVSLHRDMMNHLIRAPINLYHDLVQRGQILNQLSKDLVLVDFVGSVMSGNAISFGTTLISSIIMSAIYQPYCLFFIPLLLFLWLGVTNFYLVASRQLAKLESQSRTPILNMINEVSFGVETIKAFKAKEIFIKQFRQKQDDSIRYNYFVTGGTLWLYLILDLFSFSFLFVEIMFTLLFPQYFIAVTVGLLLNYSIQIQNNLTSFIIHFSAYVNSMFAFERCLSYTNIISEKPEKTTKDSTLTDWPVKGSITFDNVSVQYRNDTETVLSGISFKINSGEKIGICGRTGSGKSTLALSLLRLLEVKKGAIFIDDVDISEIGLSKLRSNITIIPQEPCLVEGTLKYNIDPLNIYSDETIMDIMKEINFWYICENNEDGLNMKINGNGENFSGGERQLICIVRALLRQSKIIILDEATSNIDIKKEELIQSVLFKNMKGSTALVIAHRIKTIKNFDKILVLDNGKVKEFDTPENLLKERTSLFYELYHNSKL